MINKTTQPMLVNPTMSPVRLDKAIRKALRYVITNEARHLGSPSGAPVLRHHHRGPTFAYFFVDGLKERDLYTEDFLQQAFQVCQTSHICSLPESLQAPTILALIKSTGNLRALEPIRSGFRPFFVHLWFQRIIMLPISFTVERSLKHHNYIELLSEVAAMFYNYDRSTAKRPQNHPTLGSWNDSQFNRDVHRIIWTTDWHSFKKVNLQELSEFHILSLKGVEGFPNVHWDFIPMLKEMLNQHAGRMKFTAEDVELYRKWIRGGWYADHSFPYFCQNLPDIRIDSRRRYGQRNIERYKKGILRRSGIEITTGLDLSKPAMHILLESISARADHDAALDYYAKLSGINRSYGSTAPYPGREHIDVGHLSAVWQRTFTGWLDHRQNLSLESEDVHLEIKVLCDYLFCYLPWWLELHPLSGIEFPYSPANFERFKFFTSSGRSTSEAPVPFNEMFKLRRKTVNSQGRTISLVNNYFEYIQAYANRYPELSGVSITNPIVLGIDYPKGRKRNSKTTKVPFPKKVMPYLLRYFYALEEFGMHLQQLAVQGKLQLTLKTQPPILKPEEYGYSLKFEFNGKIYPVLEVPNVFPLVRRTIRTKEGMLITVEIPHLSRLRILLGGLETGLRIQAIQWLDLRHWDSLNINKSADLYVYELYVNTDKTMNGPWVAPLVYRARGVFLREQEFQQSIVEEGMDKLVPYEQRKKSRFEAVLPLFRAGGYTGNPVDDGRYFSAWIDILFGFQGFYNSQVSDEGFTQFVNIGPHYLGGVKAAGNERVDHLYLEGEQVPYCPLRYSAIHTPHSVRATFISNRSGILDIEDIARSVGHTNTKTTYHYTVEELGQLVSRIEKADRQLWSYDTDNPVHIRADHENSALKKSMARNRKETETRFGFVSVSLINEKTESDKEGVELLRTTPMNQIVFRETHICPVGESCPKDIEDLIHEPRRCGLCPLAVKTVDHLPAIAAKMRQLLEQVQSATLFLEKLENKGEPEAVLEQVNERRKLDTLEYTGWMRVFGILSDILVNVRDDSTTYHVEAPEIVKRHLKLVVKQSSKVEFILDRIMDSEAYPSMQTPELRAKANLLRQQLLVNLGRVAEALQEIEPGDEISAFLSSLKVEMQALGLTTHSLLEMKLLENSNRGDQIQAPLLSTPSRTVSTSDSGSPTKY